MRKLLLTATIVLICTNLFADTLYLDNGKEVDGSITVRGADTIIIRTEGGIEEIPRKHVIRIVSGPVNDAPPATASPAAPSAKDLLKQKAFEPMKYNDWVSQQAKETAADEFTTVKVTPAGRRIESVLKLSVDLPGDHYAKVSLTDGDTTASGSYTEATTMGFSLSGESVGYLTDHLGAGLGLAYQLPRKMKNYDGYFNFLPVYAVVKARTKPVTGRRYYYLTGHIGYDFFFADKDYKGDTATLSGGTCYGFGAGALFDKVNFELLYSVSNGSLKDTLYYLSGSTIASAREKMDVRYSTLALTVGVNFQ